MGLDFLMNPSRTVAKDHEPFHTQLDVLREETGSDEDGDEDEIDEIASESFEDEDEDEGEGGDDEGDDEPPPQAFRARRAPSPPPPGPPRQAQPKPQAYAGAYKIPAGATVEDIKRDLLYQFERLEKKGYKLHRRFTMASGVDDMRQEYDRMVRDKKVDAAVRFQQTCLMGFVTGAELLNNRFDPFDLKLDGWSENVHAKIADYDDTFEELATKYSSNRQMAPELKLLLSVVGSAFMFHMTKKLSDVMPGMGEILSQNPDLQRQFAGAAANMVQKDDAGSGLGGLAGMFSGMFNNRDEPRAQPMRGPSGQQAPPQAPQAQNPPQGRSSAADVLNFMRSRNGAAPGGAPMVSEDNVEIMSQSDASEISEVVSLSGKRRAGKKRATLDL
jgi:hypothetical protein